MDCERSYAARSSENNDVKLCRSVDTDGQGQLDIRSSRGPGDESYCPAQRGPFLINCLIPSTSTEQYVDRELIKPLIGQMLLRHHTAVIVVSTQLLHAVTRVLTDYRDALVFNRNLG